ncbi:MAG: phage holin family protein [Vampirovibrio sp.]|nr:phage holin family protein [Vampirovibrio sp.]
MKQWLIRQLLLLLLLSSGLLALPWLYPQFYVADWQTGVQVSICLLLVELIVQPLVALLLVPINFLTLGLLGFIVRVVIVGVAIALTFLALPTVGFKAPPPLLLLVQVVATYAIWASGCLTVMQLKR